MERMAAGGGDDANSEELTFPAHLSKRTTWPGPDNDRRWKTLEEIFVILFPIQGGGEGIYSLHTASSNDEVVSAVLIFEDAEDAVRYSGMLMDDNMAPRVQACEPIEIEVFLLEKDKFSFTFVPAGTTLMPPILNDLIK